MDQVLQVVGALLILAAFVLAQVRRLDHHSYAYLVLNLLGSALLAVLAYVDHQWGFLLLEGVWAVVSAWGLVARMRGRGAGSAP
jgi:membrane-bound ClpP family serine protease